MPVDLDDIHRRVKLLFEMVAQGEQAFTLAVHVCGTEGTGLAQADDTGDIERARAEAPLLAAALLQGCQTHTGATATHIECAHALGAVELVTRHGEEIDIVGLDIGWHLPDPLGGIGVEDDALVVAQIPDLGDLVDRTDLVVGPHDGDQDRVFTQGVLDHLAGDDAVGTGFEPGDIEAVLFESLARVEYGLVLMDRGDDVAAVLLAGGLLGVHVRRALDGQVVALG